MDNPYETSPWGPRDGRRPQAAPEQRPAREPVLSRRRWPAVDLLLIGLILAGFGLQLFARPELTGGLALFPARVAAGDPVGLLSHIFLHGGIVHILFNLSAFVALASPVHAALGDLWKDNLRSAGVFLLLFLVSGIVGGLAFVLLNLGGTVPAVGASGAICGLWGAASRVASQNGELLPIRHPHVGRNARNFLIMNLVLILLSFGLSALAGGGVGGIAWEAHLGGYLVGLLFIPAFQKLARGQVLRWGGGPGAAI